MKKEVIVYLIDVVEPDGEYRFPFSDLDEVMKFAHICDMFGFKISRFDTDIVELDY